MSNFVLISTNKEVVNIGGNVWRYKSGKQEVVIWSYAAEDWSFSSYEASSTSDLTDMTSWYTIYASYISRTGTPFLFLFYYVLYFAVLTLYFIHVFIINPIFFIFVFTVR